VEVAAGGAVEVGGVGSEVTAGAVVVRRVRLGAAAVVVEVAAVAAGASNDASRTGFRKRIVPRHVNHFVPGTSIIRARHVNHFVPGTVNQLVPSSR